MGAKQIKTRSRSVEAEQNSQGLQHLKNVTLLFQVRRLQPVLNFCILKYPSYFIGFYYPFGVFLSSLNLRQSCPWLKQLKTYLLDDAR